MSSGVAKIGKPAPGFRCQALDGGIFKVWKHIKCHLLYLIRVI